MRLFAAIFALAIALTMTLNESVPTKVSADFRQVKTSSLYKGEKVSCGHFVYVAPDYMKWEYTQPAKMCWETTDKKNNPMFASIVSVIKDCVSGNFDSNRKFRISKDKNSLTLVPVDNNISQALSKIVISLDPNNGMAQSVTVYEKKGGVTVITFSNVKRDVR